MWAVKEEQIKKLKVAEMKWLRAIRGGTKLDRRRNEEVQNEAGVIGIREAERKQTQMVWTCKEESRE